MTRLLQINITANWGSHGKIAESIGLLVLARGWESTIAYGRWFTKSASQLYHIGSMFDEYCHVFSSRLLDNHGLMSAWATHRLIKFIKEYDSDIIHLHNIHGYYLNYPILFNFLAQLGKPVVWTLHDCWPFTGHCAHYTFAKCEKWKTHCEKCPLLSTYPRSLFLDRSFRNFELKKKYFLSVRNVTLVPVSRWLEKEVEGSFLKNDRIRQIYNGINTELFNPCNLNIRSKYNIPNNKKVVLGVASNWYHKGLDDYVKLRAMLPQDYVIVLVGLTDKDMKSCTQGIIGIKRTSNVEELVALYSMADVYFNPTHEDNFPTTNLEAMSCGTPVVTYDVGGCKESITPATGCVIEMGNLQDACHCIFEIVKKGKSHFVDKCHNHVKENFNDKVQMNKYINLYDEILDEKQ